MIRTFLWSGRWSFVVGRLASTLAASTTKTTIDSRPLLSKSTRDVVFRLLVRRFGENLFCLIELNQFAQQKETREFCHACRLLHVVRHNDDGIPLFELEY